MDDEDAHLAKLKWYAERREQTWYATRNLPKVNGRNVGVVRMHTLVLGKPPGDLEIDHINRNGLDNRRANLRYVTPRQNHANTGKTKTKTYTTFKGVYWHKRQRTWWAQIHRAGRTTYLGKFGSADEAARAYDAAARAVDGPFARLNFPDAQAA